MQNSSIPKMPRKPYGTFGLPRRSSLSEVVESFYLETEEGLFFAVKGLEHPQDRWISVLRYAPDPENGDRDKAGILYRRFYQFEEQERFLRFYHPQYLAHDPVFQSTLQSVPESALRRVYDPRSRFNEMTKTAPESAIEKDAVAFGQLLQAESEVPRSAIGMSGSLLIGLHRKSSDLDLSVFGMQNCKRVHHTLRRLLDSRAVETLCRFDAAGIEALYYQRVTDTEMPFDAFAAIEKDKVCQGSFHERPYFIRFIKEAREMECKYGSVRYTPLGRATVTGVIADDEESILTPCRYLLSGARVLQGPDLCIDEIVSFRGRFCEQARAGDTVTGTGIVERLDFERGQEIRHRLLLGNSSRDVLFRGSRFS